MRVNVSLQEIDSPGWAEMHGDHKLLARTDCNDAAAGSRVRDTAESDSPFPLPKSKTESEPAVCDQEP